MNSSSSAILSQSINLQNFIPSNLLEELMEDCERIRVFDPVSTLHCFLLQILNRGSCKEALAAFNSVRLKNKLKTTSMNSSAYCKARRKLNVDCLRKIALNGGCKVERQASQWRWKGKEVFIIDGTVIQVEDTGANQKEYPLIEFKGKQLGQPKARLLACFGLASGALVDAELGKYSGKGQGETTLIRKMLPRIKKKSILLLDRFYTSFFLQHELRTQQIDYVIRARDEFAKSKMEKKQDLNIDLPRPQMKDYKHDKNFDTFPRSMKVRMIKSTIKRKGFRSATLFIMTSLLDKKYYTKKDIEFLYMQRWNVELDIRNFKQTIGGSFLLTKSPDMVVREIWARLIAYNLIRKILQLKAKQHGNLSPRKWSFKTALSIFRNVIFNLGKNRLGKLLKLMSTEKLNAKYRWEPRALKRRPHRFCYLTKPRSEAKAENWGYARRSGERAWKNGYGNVA